MVICLEGNDLVGTNMSQERFHDQLKEQFPTNGAPRVDQLLYIIFDVINTD